MLVPKCPGWNTLAFQTANSTVLQAPVFYPCLWAPQLTLGFTETCHKMKPQIKSPISMHQTKYIKPRIWSFFIYIPEPAVDTSKREEPRTRKTSRNVTKASFIFFPQTEYLFTVTNKPPKIKESITSQVLSCERVGDRVRPEGLFIVKARSS